MEYILITSDKFQTLHWSGGTTQQLYIFPPTANYQQRNFQFRLSTATVEVEKSDFTSLPGISRKLMVLDGSILINHEGYHSKQLNKFDVDEFEGDWKTSAIGKCIDFNLMTNGNTSGELSAIDLKKEDSASYKVKANVDWAFIYLYSGSVGMHINHTIVTLHKGDLLVLQQPTIAEIKITGIENSELVLTEICF